MLSTQHITVSFGDRTIFSDINVTIRPSARIGLVGQNGSGKSTFLKVLAGSMKADSGVVQGRKGTRVAYLPQSLQLNLHDTVYRSVETAFQREFEIEKRRELTTEELKLPDNPNQAKLLDQLSEIDSALEHSGFWHRSTRIGKVLTGLGFPPADFDRAVESFSGGRRMRIALASVLLQDADVLLLDEPTNYLDIETREWLLQYLEGHSASIVIVSHDRAFLDDLVTEILEVFMGSVRRFKGTYSTYVAQRHAQMEQMILRYNQQQKEISRIEAFIRRFRSNASKAPQVQSRVQRLEKMERIEIPQNMRPINIRIPPAPKSGSMMVELKGVTKSYGSNRVLSNVTITVNRHQRVAVAGPNGAGKSTLLRILAGVDDDFSGEFRYGTDVLPAYFAQDSTAHLPEKPTVLEYGESHIPYSRLPDLRDVLGAFLFSGDDVHKPVGVLSGGERTRLILATMLLNPVNLLLLDEPTNHLDMVSTEVLAKALTIFDGSVIFVSHDRFFNTQAATEVLEITPFDETENNWNYYPGDYEYFFYRKMREDSNTSSPTDSSHNTFNRTSRNQEDFHAHKRARSDYLRNKRREEEIITLLDETETRREEILAALADPNLYAEGIGEQIRSMKAEVSALSKREKELHDEWIRLEEALNG